MDGELKRSRLWRCWGGVALTAWAWVLLSFLRPAVVSAQVVPPADPCTAGDADKQYAEVARGDTVTICFQYPVESFSLVKYFRIRRAQSLAGGYYEWFRLAPAHAQDHYYFQFPVDRQWYIFATTVWDETQPDGSKITRESPGSRIVQVAIRDGQAVATPMASPEPVHAEERIP